MAKVIAMASLKGGVTKTATTVNLGAGLARRGKRVLLIDADAQGSLSVSLGVPQPDELDGTLATAFRAAMEERELDLGALIRRHWEGMDFIAGNIELADIEISLVNAMTRETVMRTFSEPLKDNYDYILIDTAPNPGLVTLNALAAADKVIIPVPAQYLPLKGLEQLLKYSAKIKRRVNPGLETGGILLTLLDRTNYAKQIVDALENAYGGTVPIFGARIPRSVKAAEASAAGMSAFGYDPRGKVAEEYEKLTEEVLQWRL
jgi:chromosome partitioning protein